MLLSRITTVGLGDLRFGAHRVADAIYEALTGVPGAFSTRIAYITATGLGNDQRYELVVADADGFGPQSIVGSPEPLLSPAWSPDGRKLAYVSFEQGNSAIYMQDVSTGARELISSGKGINGAPSFSPDGKKMAMTLSKIGNPGNLCPGHGDRPPDSRLPSTGRSIPNRSGRPMAATFISPRTGVAGRRFTGCRRPVEHRNGSPWKVITMPAPAFRPTGAE